MTVVQMPDGTVRDYSGPGVIMLSHRLWDPKTSDRTISQLVASQWWGNGVLPASTADTWITDGLARYSEELYAEQAIGKEAGLRAIDEFAVGALMFDNSAPVAQSAAPDVWPRQRQRRPRQAAPAVELAARERRCFPSGIQSAYVRAESPRRRDRRRSAAGGRAVELRRRDAW